MKFPYPGSTKTKEQIADYWRRHPIELPTSRVGDTSLSLTEAEISELKRRIERLELRNAVCPADKQEVYELRHLVRQLLKRVNELSRTTGGNY